jgi:hypothetical protein
MPKYYKPVFDRTKVWPVNSMTQQLEQFREAIVYLNKPTFKATARNVKTPYPSVTDAILSPIAQIIAGVVGNIFRGLVNLVVLPVVTIFNLFIDIARMLITRFSRPSVDQFRINTGLIVPRLLSSVSAVIGGALLVASSPFVAMVRLGRTFFPETFGVKFDNNNDSSSGYDFDPEDDNPPSSNNEIIDKISHFPAHEKESRRNTSQRRPFYAANVSQAQDDTTGLSQNSIFSRKNTHLSETTPVPQSTISNS